MSMNACSESSRSPSASIFSTSSPSNVATETWSPVSLRYGVSSAIGGNRALLSFAICPVLAVVGARQG